MEDFGIKSLMMIHSGLCLSIGFFAGKKISKKDSPHVENAAAAFVLGT
jgi:hypothetical protein